MQSLLRRWHPCGWLSATRKIYRLQVQKTMPERNLRYQGTAFLSGPKIQLFWDWGKRKKFQISSFINQKKTEDARLSFRFSFTSRSPLSFNSFSLLLSIHRATTTNYCRRNVCFRLHVRISEIRKSVPNLSMTSTRFENFDCRTAAYKSS